MLSNNWIDYTLTGMLSAHWNGYRRTIITNWLEWLHHYKYNYHLIGLITWEQSLPTDWNSYIITSIINRYDWSHIIKNNHYQLTGFVISLQVLSADWTGYITIVTNWLEWFLHYNWFDSSVINWLGCWHRNDSITNWLERFIHCYQLIRLHA